MKIINKMSLDIYILILFFFFLSNYSYSQKKSEEYRIVINDSISLSFMILDFDTINHSISYCKVGNWEGPYLIDSTLIFGTDFSIPNYIIESGDLLINGKKISLDISCMYEKPNIGSFNMTQTDGGLYINGAFSDGAGLYFVQWKIIGLISIRTIISNDEKLWTTDW